MKANTTVLISILSALFMANSARGQVPYASDSIMKCKMPGVVAYTFDDGPAEFNDQLLAILARKNVKASFFVLGERLNEFPQQAKKIYDAGHVLASHTYSHKVLDPLFKQDEIKTRQLAEKEMKDTSDLLFTQAGVRPNYMRPPQGECGHPACRQVMAEQKYVVTHWNVDTNDWRYEAMGKNDKANATKNAMEEITDKIINKSDPTKDSFIILQHELLDWSVNMLTERLIDEVGKKGYRFVTIDECLGTAAYVGGTAPPPTTNPVPPTTNPTTPAPGTGNPAPGTGNPAPGTGNPAPGTGNTAPGTPSGNIAVPSGASTGPEPEKTQSGASIQQIGAWAMGAAALASYLLL
ncbi:hypothetical protein DFQ27_003822 [Actinomortierella ambigua]|uniref:NodB homology domain-containing protein n=1 Tax=Actinomortierella ambigua TaxID=1343610 RepID=A0A9P6U5C9_9FUNG|nr:hypothetical protein DFQ27_003822 [Actinomortierella ambigua]